MAEPTRLALIGCGGNMTNAHLPRLLAQDEVSIVALVDPVSETTEALRERQPALAGAATFTDHERMLDAVQPDGVVISSPHALHHPQIIAALRAGAHVLVEKPMVNTDEEAAEVIATRDEAGKIVMVSYQRRFEPSVQQMKQIITEGGIGDVQFVTAQLHQSWYTNNLGRIQRTGESWRVQQQLSGGGQLNDSGSHLVDLVLHLVDRAPTRVAASQQYFTLEVDVNSAIMAEFEGGVIATIAIGGNVYGGGADLTIAGSGGTLHYRTVGQVPRQPWVEWRRADESESLTLPTPPPATSPDHHFVDVIRGRAALAGATAEDGRRVVQLSAAVWRAAESGAPAAVAG
ncbi:MAG: Gfo/Idh/MocA family oxidoreductase [Chloroflexota bacterium]|nr:Gfo/Idh/MocA family oxidoreductase [Chloroflexota bacterium]